MVGPIGADWQQFVVRLLWGLAEGDLDCFPTRTESPVSEDELEYY